jgi:hypothetical protein
VPRSCPHRSGPPALTGGQTLPVSAKSLRPELQSVSLMVSLFSAARCVDVDAALDDGDDDLPPQRFGITGAPASAARDRSVRLHRCASIPADAVRRLAIAPLALTTLTFVLAFLCRSAARDLPTSSDSLNCPIPFRRPYRLPYLLKTDKLPDDSEQWSYELKLDGYRAIACKVNCGRLAAHWDGYSGPCSCTRRTARSRTSGEYRLGRAMNVSSQGIRPRR